MAIGKMSQRLTAGVGLAGLVLYMCWIGWPYLESIVVRDAAVTTWVNVTTSPIRGYMTNALYPGTRTGADGRIATITDTRADARDLAQARAEWLRAEARTNAQAALVGGMRRALQTRATHAHDFADTFVQDLDTSIGGATSSLASLQLRLGLARTEVERQTSLNRAGLVSQSALDSARGVVAELEREIADAQSGVVRSTERHRAAREGVFLLEDGTDGNSAFQNLADARLRLVQAEATLTQLRAERDAARIVLQATQASYDTSRSLDVLVPPGAMVWNLISGPGAPVQPGSPLASWVDCRTMLVDVPLSDVETALLHPGSVAEVVVEGEKKARRGTVILIRGSAGTLGSSDLAALAKGRRPGIGQALVKLVPSPADIRSCPIGHAAYVDFPEVGAFDILRARLRW
jgi:multidrug resistance efflux pump